MNDERPMFLVPPSWLECPELLGELKALDAGGTAQVHVMERVGDEPTPLTQYLER